MENGTKQKKPSRKWAVASLICGILGSYSMSTFSLLAVILGHVALIKIKKHPDLHRGYWFVVWGLVLGYIGLALTIVKVFLQYQINNL